MNARVIASKLHVRELRRGRTVTGKNFLQLSYTARIGDAEQKIVRS